MPYQQKRKQTHLPSLRRAKVRFIKDGSKYGVENGAVAIFSKGNGKERKWFGVPEEDLADKEEITKILKNFDAEWQGRIGQNMEG